MSDKWVNYSHKLAQTKTTSWLVCGWSTFGARTSHEHTQTYKTHHDPNLGEATTFPLIIFSVINQRGCIQMLFCPKTPKLGFLKLTNWDSQNFERT
jgi:hypothetical protein